MARRKKGTTKEGEGVVSVTRRVVSSKPPTGKAKDKKIEEYRELWDSLVAKEAEIRHLKKKHGIDKRSAERLEIITKIKELEDLLGEKGTKIRSEHGIGKYAGKAKKKPTSKNGTKPGQKVPPEMFPGAEAEEEPYLDDYDGEDGYEIEYPDDEDVEEDDEEASEAEEEASEAEDEDDVVFVED